MIKKIGLAALILIVLISGGCWNKKEPNDLALIDSIVYNKTQDGKYQVIVEFLNLSGSGKKTGAGGGSGETSEKKSITLTAAGESYREAIANIASSIEKTIYGGHNHVRFFTESAAKSDMAATIDNLLRDHLTDETPLMVVIKGDNAEKIYESSIGLADSVGAFIDRMQITQQESSSMSVFVTTLNFFKDFFNDGKEPVTGVVQAVKSKSDTPASETDSKGAEDKDQLLYEGLAAFKGDKLVGFFNGSETRAYNFITGKIGVAIVTVPFENSSVICEVTKASSDVKTSIKDESAAFDLEIKADVRVIGCDADVNPGDPSIMRQIEKAFNSYLLPQIAGAVQKAQKDFSSDIFGFGMSVHEQHPKDWQRIKEDWGRIFPEATVKISVASNVYQTSETKDSILSEFTED